MRFHLLGAVLLAAVACSGGTDDGKPVRDHGDAGDAGDSGDSGDSGAVDDTADDTGDTGDSGDTGLPPDPTPFTLHVSGPVTKDLVFDLPSCTQPLGSSNFSQFWRNASDAHVFVLAVQLLGTYTGPGTYDSATDGVNIKLQEEAGGTGLYFFMDKVAGDTASLTIDHIDKAQAWGEFEFSGLHDGTGAAVSVSPMPIPVWCPTLN